MRLLRYADLAMHGPLLRQDHQPEEGILLRKITPDDAAVRRLPVLVVVGRK